MYVQNCTGIYLVQYCTYRYLVQYCTRFILYVRTHCTNLTNSVVLACYFLFWESSLWTRDSSIPTSSSLQPKQIKSFLSRSLFGKTIFETSLAVIGSSNYYEYPPRDRRSRQQWTFAPFYTLGSVSRLCNCYNGVCHLRGKSFVMLPIGSIQLS